MKKILLSRKLNIFYDCYSPIVCYVCFYLFFSQFKEITSKNIYEPDEIENGMICEIYYLDFTN